MTDKVTRLRPADEFRARAEAPETDPILAFIMIGIMSDAEYLAKHDEHFNVSDRLVKAQAAAQKGDKGALAEISDELRQRRQCIESDKRFNRIAFLAVSIGAVLLLAAPIVSGAITRIASLLR